MREEVVEVAVAVETEVRVILLFAIIWLTKIS